MKLKLQLCEIAGDLGAGPVLRADELSPQDALSVDDVCLRNLHCAVQSIDPLVRVANREEIHMMLGQKTPVDVRILVHADRDDRHIRHLPLQRQQAGQLFDARSAKGRPKIQHDDVPAQFAQVDLSGAIADDKLRRRLVDVSRDDFPGRIPSPATIPNTRLAQTRRTIHSTSYNTKS